MKRGQWILKELDNTTTCAVVNYLLFLRRPPGRRSLLSRGVRGAEVDLCGGQELEGVARASRWVGVGLAGAGVTRLDPPAISFLVEGISLLEKTASCVNRTGLLNGVTSLRLRMV